MNDYAIIGMITVVCIAFAIFQDEIDHFIPSYSMNSTLSSAGMDETDLQCEYAPFMFGGDVLSGTVYADRYNLNSSGMGWIL